MGVFVAFEAFYRDVIRMDLIAFLAILAAAKVLAMVYFRYTDWEADGGPASSSGSPSFLTFDDDDLDSPVLLPSFGCGIVGNWPLNTKASG